MNNNDLNNFNQQGFNNNVGMPNQGMNNQMNPTGMMPNQGINNQMNPTGMMPNQGMNNQMNPTGVMPNQGMNNQMNPNGMMPNQGMNNQMNLNGMMPNQGMNNIPSKNKNNKLLMLIGIIGTLIVVVVVICLLANNGDMSSGKKLECSIHHAMVGVVVDEKINISIKDESAIANTENNYDIAAMLQGADTTASARDYEEYFDKQADEAREECKIQKCSVKTSSSLGKNYVIKINNIAIENVDGKTEDEIYDLLKSKYESQNYKCK